MTDAARLWLRLALFAPLGVLASWLAALTAGDLISKLYIPGSPFLLTLYGAAFAACVAVGAVLRIWRRALPVTILASLVCLVAPAIGLYAAFVTFYANWPGDVSPI